MTLVETLAIITIISIVMIILTSILSNGLNVSEKQKSKSSLHQQANYVLVVWREYHEDGNPYEIIVSEDQAKITFNLLDNANSETIIKSQVIEYPNYLFTLYIDNEEDPLTEIQIYSKSQKVIPIKILMEDAKNNNKQEIKTTLSRL